MPVVRKWGENHVNKSLKQIDSNAWLVGNLVLHRSHFPSESATWNDDGDNSSYTLMEAPAPPPSATTPLASPYIKLVHEADDASGVWSIGNNALCKVRYIEEGVTPESVTLDFVRDQRPSFEIPKVYTTLSPSLNEHWRRRYVDAVVNVCKEMAQWKGHVFGGVDGKNIPEPYLLKSRGPVDFSSANPRAACEAMGMDCLNLVFNHADLGPTNIIVENKPNSGKVGIIDFGSSKSAWSQRI